MADATAADDVRPVRVCLTRCPLPPAESSVHSLPCHIHHNGRAAIKSYFHPEATDAGDDATWRAEFRGVQLEGRKLDLACMGCKGLLLEDAGMTHAEDEGRIWEVDGHFDALTVWQVPGSDEAIDVNLPKTLAEWTAISNAIHGGDDV